MPPAQTRGLLSAKPQLMLLLMNPKNPVSAQQQLRAQTWRSQKGPPLPCSRLISSHGRDSRGISKPEASEGARSIRRSASKGNKSIWFLPLKIDNIIRKQQMHFRAQCTGRGGELPVLLLGI